MFNVYFLAIPISDAIWILMFRYTVYMFCLPVLFVFCQWCVRTSEKVEPSCSNFFKIPPNEKHIPQNPPAARSKLFSIYNFISFHGTLFKMMQTSKQAMMVRPRLINCRCKTNSWNMGVSDPGLFYAKTRVNWQIEKIALVPQSLKHVFIIVHTIQQSTVLTSIQSFAIHEHPSHSPYVYRPAVVSQDSPPTATQNFPRHFKSKGPHINSWEYIKHRSCPSNTLVQKTHRQAVLVPTRKTNTVPTNSKLCSHRDASRG